MLLLFVRRNLRLDKLLLNSPLTTKGLDVGELVDEDGVLAIECDAIELLACSLSLFRRLVLNKGVTILLISNNPPPSLPGELSVLYVLPLCLLPRLIHRHEHRIRLDLSNIAQLLAQELDKLCLALLRDNGASVDNHKCVETLVESDIELFLEI